MHTHYCLINILLNWHSNDLKWIKFWKCGSLSHLEKMKKSHFLWCLNLFSEFAARRRQLKKWVEKWKAYGTWYSQAVTHPSTNQARRCLTSVIGREPVLSTWYGRKHLVTSTLTLYLDSKWGVWEMRDWGYILGKLAENILGDGGLTLSNWEPGAPLFHLKILF